ncbi:MAG TPA: 1,4-alpha-glucan branching protein GlgB [Terriglobia bacterium]|nr:1,4-alpha-glucan branching protein GlgB [Terriglobia bacterium]
MSRFSNDDLHLFNEGTHSRLYRRLGAHIDEEDGASGVSFSVWAPNAEAISVIGDFNDWNTSRNPMRCLGDSGIWEAFVPGATSGQAYKYHVVSRVNGYTMNKADPFAYHAESLLGAASKIWDLRYEWNDSNWISRRSQTSGLDRPISIYELHLGSWRRVPEEGNRSLSYREAAPLLADHLEKMRFTHVEFLPLTEHPFYGSWGYQTTGYFAPTSRYGTPQDLMFLIDYLHQRGFGVILDWVPSHFPGDDFALGFFDGTHLYEHSDPRQGLHKDWDSKIFNYGRHEVRSFLISSAFFWLDVYHVDALRVDAVASMLYLDYSRSEGEWIPNRFGGRENLEAVDFLRRFNAEVYRDYPSVQTIAEESTAWPAVSRPAHVGGLGFGLKWDMGWMHDTLRYMSRDPIHRKYHQNELTFRSIYAFHENFVLPLSHDEVVHGKGSLLSKMPGDLWQKFANLRLLFAYMFAQPGKKLLFMGAELAQWREWNHDDSLDWHLLQFDSHRQIQQWIADLNRVYREQPALHELDCEPAGFEWIDGSDSERSVLGFMRVSRDQPEIVLAIFNFTPVPRYNYRVGAPREGFWTEILNSDAGEYGGADFGNLGGVWSHNEPCHGRPYSLSLTLPPLGALFLKSP